MAKGCGAVTVCPIFERGPARHQIGRHRPGGPFDLRWPLALLWPWPLCLPGELDRVGVGV